MYKIGEFVVYKRDVCKVIEIKEKYFNNVDYYILIPVFDKSLKISVPKDSDLIRDLINKEELEKIITAMPNIKIIETDNKMIENDYKELLQTGTHENLIKIIKTTYLRNQERLENNKKIGDKDDNYFNLAEKHLYSEFSVVLNLTIEEAKEYVINKLEINKNK